MLITYVRYLRPRGTVSSSARSTIHSRVSRGELVSMTIDLSELEEEYEKMTNTPVVAVRPPASCSQAQKASSFLSVCPTGLAALDCRPLLNTSVEEIVRSPVALPHGLGSNSWPIAPGLC